MSMKQVTIQSSDVDNFTEFIKSFDTHKAEGNSHDIYFNGFHIYYYEGQEDGGGVIHVWKEEI